MGTKDRGEPSDGQQQHPSPGDKRIDAMITIITATNGVLDAVMLLGNITENAALATMTVAKAALTATAALLTACKHRQR